MALTVKERSLKYLILSAGTLGSVLRAVLYATGVDEKGLLVTGHWAGTGVWLLTAAVAAAMLILLRDLTGPEQYRDAFPASVFSAAGSILAGVAFLLCGAPEAAEGNLAIAELVLRFAAAISLACVGFCRFAGRKPFPLLHGAVCLYLALRMVCQYRLWSADPQLQNYCFCLGAYLALMLTAYQLAAFDAGFGSHKKLWTCGLAAVYLCAVSLAGNGEAFFLLCSGIWTFTSLSSLKHRRRKPPVTEEGA